MTGKVITRPGETRTTFDSGDAYIERIEAAVAVFKSKNLNPERPVPEQMNETAAKGTGRVRNPVYHYVLSWQKKSVTHKEAHKAVARTVEALGARGWQWVGALHGDTDNPHCHVIINRIHPETGLAWRSSHDRYKLAKICREIEPVIRHEIADLPSPRAADYEVYTGQLSLQSWARAEVMPLIAERVLSSRNRSWDATHRVLAERGLTYDSRGVIRDATGSSPVETRGGGISNTLNLAYLEKRLGPYEERDSSISIAAEGYGSARDRYELTTERMRRPDLAPFYARWVAARKDWENGGRERAAMDRIETKRHAARETKEVRDDLRIARGILSSSVPELADALWKRLGEIADARVAEIHEACDMAIKTITKSKPHELFRTWLKNLAKNGDAEAAQAAQALRQGETMEHASPSIDGRAGMRPNVYHAYAERAASAASRWILAADEVTPKGEQLVLRERMNAAWTELGPDGTQGTPNEAILIQKVEKALTIATEAMSVEERNEMEFVRASLIASMTWAVQQDERSTIVANCAAAVPFAVRAESDERKNPLDPRVARTLWSVMRDHETEHDVGFGDACPGSAATCRHASSIWRDAINMGLDANAEMPQDYVPLHREGENENRGRTAEEADELDEEMANDFAVDNGTIGGPSRQSSIDPEEQSYRLKYYAFLENFAAVGFGQDAQEKQAALERERYRNIEISKAATIKNIPEKNWMERAEVDAQTAKYKANVARTARMESDVIRLVTGANPPPSFHEYLKSLDEERANHLAARIAHQEDMDAARYHSKRAEAALHVTVRHTKNGLVYAIDGKDRFHDDGEIIHVNSSRDKQACDAALLIAAERFGDNLELTGNRWYKDAMLKRAVELGIHIGNPELQEQQARLIEERDERRKLETLREYPTDLSEQFDETVADPKATVEERRLARNQVLEQAATRVFETEYKITTQITQHDEVGTVEDLLILPENAYALLRNRDDEYVVVPLEPRYARDMMHLRTMRAEVAVSPASLHTGYSELVEVPTDEQVLEAEAAQEREMEMASGGRTRGGGR